MSFVFDTTNLPFDGYVADKDITCYKIIIQDKYKVWCSLVYKAISWKKGQERETTLGWDPGFVRLCKWYSPFDTVWHNEEYSPRYVKNNYWFFERFQNTYVDCKNLRMSRDGFYSFTHFMNGEMRRMFDDTIKSRTWDFPVAACRFVIPKGSRYFVSDDGMQYTSERIRFEDFCIIQK